MCVGGWVCITFASQFNPSAWMESVDGDEPENSSIPVFLVNPAFVIATQARPFPSFPEVETPTHIHTHLDRRVTVWTPGQDLEVSGIPSSKELNSSDYPTQST